MNRRSQRQMKLSDCLQHGHNSELFIVEGESAANSVSAICDSRFQAVLPLQGKPLNASKASEEKVKRSALHVQFAQALGLAAPTAISAQELSDLKYGRIFLLFDPDADGIHIGALILLYIQRWLPQLISQKKVVLLRVPMFAVDFIIDSVAYIEFAFMPAQLNLLKAKVREQGGIILKTERFQSVGSVPPNILETHCINPITRQATLVDEAHVNMVQNLFG